jgi:hypothetical protein
MLPVVPDSLLPQSDRSNRSKVLAGRSVAHKTSSQIGRADCGRPTHSHHLMWRSALRLCLCATAAGSTVGAMSMAPATSPEDRILVWHITDPHIDPFYRAGTPTEACYCRPHALCPARPESASCAPGASGGSGPFGNAEADCETPEDLFTSSLQHAATVSAAADLVLFTGDFCAYMLETPCNNSAAGLDPGSSRVRCSGFPTYIYTRGCHWFPPFARSVSSEQVCDQCHSSQVITPLTG